MNSPRAYLEDKPSQKPNHVGDTLREQIIDQAKMFKTSWVDLGQRLYTVYKDKYYKSWGFERFEYYVDKEVGLKKELAMKLLKTYFFIEQEEPEYLKEEFGENRDATHVPDYEAVNLLRLARGKKELLKEDYAKIRKAIFDKGQNISTVRKELTALIKERKQVDPEEERDKRHEASIRRLLTSLRIFKKDMETLKLIPHEILEETRGLIKKLETEIT